MLIDERKNAILKLVNENGKATVQELMELFDASESTIRRDLTELDKAIISKGTWWCTCILTGNHEGYFRL